METAIKAKWNSKCNTCKDDLKLSEEFKLQKKLLKDLTKFDKVEGKYKTNYLFDEEGVKNLKNNESYVHKLERFNRKILKHGPKAVDSYNEAMNVGVQMKAFVRANECEGLDTNLKRFHKMNIAFAAKNEPCHRNIGMQQETTEVTMMIGSVRYYFSTPRNCFIMFRIRNCFIRNISSNRCCLIFI